MAYASSSTPALLTLAPQQDRAGRWILLLHAAHIPPLSTPAAELASYVRPALAHIPPTGCITLVVCHAGYVHRFDSTTRYGVRAVRDAYESDEIVPPAIRSRIEQIILLHVSFLTRAHIYVSSFGMPGRDYSKIVYCDLLVDMEKTLGVDSTLIGLEKVDFDYDSTMRSWVGRQEEHKPVKAPNPKKPLIDMANVSTDWSDAPTTAESSEQLDHDGIMAQP